MEFESELIVYFTDRHGVYPKKAIIDTPVLWIVTSDIKPLFGKIIKVSNTSFHLSKYTNGSQLTIEIIFKFNKIESI